MSFTLFPTYATGDPFTAADANTYWRDNLNVLGGGAAGQVLGYGPAWGVGGGMGLIEKVALAAPAASVDFTSIPTSFTHLRLIYQAKSSYTTSGDNLFIRFNNDSGANYNYNYLYSYYINPTQYIGTATFGPQNQFSLLFTDGYAGYGANDVSQNDMTIFNYKSTVFYKHFISHGSVLQSYFIQDMYAGDYISLSAIDRITLYLQYGPNFITGSTFSLYGML